MITIYIDGACLPKNPGGYATWAYVAKGDSGKEIAMNYECVGHGEGMTNNVAEYHALLQALERAGIEGWNRYRIKSDSQLVVNQVSGEWRCNQPALRELMMEAKMVMVSHECAIEWIPREQNTRADHLSEVAYKQALRNE